METSSLFRKYTSRAIYKLSFINSFSQWFHDTTKDALLWRVFSCWPSIHWFSWRKQCTSVLLVYHLLYSQGKISSGLDSTESDLNILCCICVYSGLVLQSQPSCGEARAERTYVQPYIPFLKILIYFTKTQQWAWRYLSSKWLKLGKVDLMTGTLLGDYLICVESDKTLFFLCTFL